MEKNEVDNGRGGRRTPPGQPAWVPASDKIAAEVIPLRGGEALRHGVERSSQLYRVTIRRRVGVTTAMRLQWGDQMLDIKTAPPTTDRITIVMTCETARS